MPLTVAPSCGAVSCTDGAVVSLSTITSTASDVARAPGASRATAVIDLGPFGPCRVSQTMA